MSSSMPEPQRPLAVTLQVVSIVLFTFIGYLNIGIPLAVLPGYVHSDLGFGAVIAGLVISVQYLATLLSRPYAGKIIDNQGSKRAVMIGLAGCGLSGVFMLISAWTPSLPMLSLISLLIGRLVLGSAESLVGSGSIGWGIGRVGAANTAKVISWNGIASYGALAVGAPFGVWLVSQLGLWSMGVSIILLAALGLLLAWPKTAAPIVAGERLPFMHVLGRVFPHGCGLALGSIGFGTIATFITLYYATQHWDNAVLCLSLFGASFIGARLLFGNLINRLGGFRVAIACLSVETLGLLLLWLAPDAHWALAGAALSGFRFLAGVPGAGRGSGESGAGVQPWRSGRRLFAVHRLVAGDHRAVGRGDCGRLRFCLDLPVRRPRRAKRLGAERVSVQAHRPKYRED